MQCSLKKNIYINEIFGTCEFCLRILSKSILTDYRDSETQTTPWEPPITSDSTPAVFTLTSLTWNNGLPAGKNELNIIKKIDIKKAWKQVLPPLDCEINFQRYKNIITQMDNDKWKFRDKELQLIVDSKLDWIDKIIKIKNSEQSKKRTKRFEQFDKYLSYLKNKKMIGINVELNRKLRKLSVKYSERYLQQNFSKIKDDKQMNLIQKKNMVNANYGTIPSVTKKSNELCLRETRWTEEKLKTLHIEMKKI